MILFFIALIAGVLTVFAPCTLALLPIIVGGTLTGGTSIRRTVTVTTSLGISVVLFTFLLKISSSFINVPPAFWHIFSGVIIVIVGLSMVFPALWDSLPFLAKLNINSNKIMSRGYMSQSFWGDVIVGASLGPVFSSCSPTYFLIIATILPASLFVGTIYLITYALGLCVTLFIVAIAGQKFLEKIGVAADPKGWVRRGIGVLFLLVGLAIAFSFDQKFELAFANANFLNRHTRYICRKYGY